MYGAVAAVVIAAIGVVAWHPWSRGAVTAPPAAASTAHVSAILVDPAAGALDVGATLQLSATPRDSAGGSVSTPVTWISADPAIATINGAGLVSGKAPGIARIMVASGGLQTNTQITVTAPLPVAGSAPAGPASRILVQGAPPSLTVGGSAQLRGTPVDTRGARSSDGNVNWSSSAPNVATVTRAGLITAHAPGSVIITARAGSISQQSNIQVVAAAAANPPPAPQAQVVAAAPTSAPAPAAAPLAAPAPAPAPPPPPPAAAAVNPRDAIASVVQAYARALESRQVSEVRKVYPGMSSAQEDQVAGTLRTLEQLHVQLAVSGLDIQGDAANATVSGEYQFYSQENRRTEHLPVHFQASFEHSAAGWLIKSMR
jgi:hypothetical protein